jgi:hypothetical protein
MKTTIQISKKTHSKLKAYAEKNGWTYEFAINKLLEKVK